MDINNGLYTGINKGDYVHINLSDARRMWDAVKVCSVSMVELWLNTVRVTRLAAVYSSTASFKHTHNLQLKTFWLIKKIISTFNQAASAFRQEYATDSGSWSKQITTAIKADVMTSFSVVENKGFTDRFYPRYAVITPTSPAHLYTCTHLHLVLH